MSSVAPVMAALVLAGSRGGVDPVAAAEGVAHKALAVVGGKPILTRVVEALREAGIARIAVAANDPAVMTLAEALGTELIPPQPGPSASVGAAFAELGSPLLVTTADHALLRAEWVRDFVSDVPSDTDAAVLLASREAVERAMPGSRRTWLRFADGEWSGCNLFLMATPRAIAAIDAWRAVEADRKRPWKIAARFGLRPLWLYVTGRLTSDGAIAVLGRRVGIDAHAVAAREGLAAVDVDKPEDLADVRRIMASHHHG
jgi:GTP:adenosylcobinamide-phosphate guanylyltransferase